MPLAFITWPLSAVALGCHLIPLHPRSGTLRLKRTGASRQRRTSPTSPPYLRSPHGVIVLPRAVAFTLLRINSHSVIHLRLIHIAQPRPKDHGLQRELDAPLRCRVQSARSCRWRDACRSTTRGGGSRIAHPTSPSVLYSAPMHCARLPPTAVCELYWYFRRVQCERSVRSAER